MVRGTIRQRSKKRKDSWNIQVYLGKESVTGKSKHYSETVRGTKSDAERRLREVLQEMDIGSFVGSTRVTLGEFLDQWLVDYCEGRLRARTVEGYRGYVERYVKPRLGNVRLDKLTVGCIEKMESWLLREGGVDGKGLSGTTVRQVHRILSSALSDAVRLGVVGRNVVKLVKPPRTGWFEPMTLSWDDVGHFMDTVENLEDRVFGVVITVALQTGLRRAEVLGLQWKDVDIKERRLAVRRSLTRMVSGREIRVESTKSGKGRRVDLADETVRVLAEHKDLQGEWGSRECFIFCDGEGAPLDPNKVTKQFKSVVREAGFGSLRFHDLRHTHASLMMAEGSHLKVVSERLGHSGVGITGDLYSHIVPSVQRESIERFGDAWEIAMANNGKYHVGK